MNNLNKLLESVSNTEEHIETTYLTEHAFVMSFSDLQLEAVDFKKLKNTFVDWLNKLFLKLREFTDYMFSAMIANIKSKTMILNTLAKSGIDFDKKFNKLLTVKFHVNSTILKKILVMWDTKYIYNIIDSNKTFDFYDIIQKILLDKYLINIDNESIESLRVSHLSIGVLLTKFKLDGVDAINFKLFKEFLQVTENIMKNYKPLKLKKEIMVAHKEADKKARANVESDEELSILRRRSLLFVRVNHELIMFQKNMISTFLDSIIHMIIKYTKETDQKIVNPEKIFGSKKKKDKDIEDTLQTTLLLT